MKKHQLIIIGGGPAGLSAALSAREKGIDDILIIDRNKKPGGLLFQCIHYGFGMRRFGEELTGPEYADRLISQIQEYNSADRAKLKAAGGVKSGIEILTDTSVVKISEDRTIMTSGKTGVHEFTAAGIIIATGCRERTIESLSVTGTRPSGVFTAGNVQKMMNIGGYSVGDNIVMLGSGDIGLIVARGLALAGKKVLAVVEQAEKCGGVVRGKAECLDTFGIPLLTRNTVSRLYGDERLTGVRISPADIEDKGFDLECDTLITSLGLIPEVDLLWDLGAHLESGQFPVNVKNGTRMPWLFVCGNAAQVWHFADDVADDGTSAGKRAAEYIL